MLDRDRAEKRRRLMIRLRQENRLPHPLTQAQRADVAARRQRLEEDRRRRSDEPIPF